MKRLQPAVLQVFIASLATLLKPQQSNAFVEEATPNLPFGDINVVVLTDVHSWVGGHGRKEPDLDADYGDVLSFYNRLKHHCDENERDLWFVMNGDWIDGTGLATNGDPSSLIPLLEKMPWDAVNVGNHELYRPEVIDYMTRPGGFVDWWGSRYLTSNIVLTDTAKPLGYPYRLLEGTQWSVLTFGFLYNMKDNAENVEVKEVAAVVAENWFREVLHGETFDAILVLAHMDLRDELVDVIISKIRVELGDDMPVQFITGHTHYRGYAVVDPSSTSFEAGRYLDTVGFVSFPAQATLSAASAANTTNTEDLFRHNFLNASVEVLRETLAVSSLSTEDGDALSEFIALTQLDLGLDEVVGCAEKTYRFARGLTEADSLWSFFRDSVVSTLLDDDGVLFLHKESWRYDLFDGEVNLGDIVAVAPFNDSLVQWTGIPTGAVVALNATLNADAEPYLPMLPNFILASGDPTFVPGNGNGTITILTASFNSHYVQRALEELLPGAVNTTFEVTKTTVESLWLDYFAKSKPCGRWKMPKNPFGPSSDRSQSSHPLSDTQEDRVRLGLGVSACFLVVVLAAIEVRHRGRVHQRAVAARNYATFSAAREYENDLI